MSEHSLPTSLFESLVEKLLHVLELAQLGEGASTPQARQNLLQATNDFKNALNQAKDIATNLPGGELLISDQDQVIAMLEDLRERKRQKLLEFSQAKLIASRATMISKMEVDSTASTPAQ